eukprot:scaffold56595_cov46-Attheya_sp.AAC.1
MIAHLSLLTKAASAFSPANNIVTRKGFQVMEFSAIQKQGAFQTAAAYSFIPQLQGTRKTSMLTMVRRPPLGVHHATRFASQTKNIFSGGHSNDMEQVSSSSGTILMMAVDDEDDSGSEDDGKKEIDSMWNVAGLKKETERLQLRCIKKSGKAITRRSAAEKKLEAILQKGDDATLAELESCPDNIDELKQEVDTMQERLAKLNELLDLLQPPHIPKRTGTMMLPPDISALAIELDVNDAPPKRPARPVKKKKGDSGGGSRLPYRKYFTLNKTEIRVGKQAEDNDELSISPKHRDGSDWWMHASGCPGSHVVIRCGSENLDEEVVKDAAALAARQSKCAGATIKVSNYSHFKLRVPLKDTVSLTRCRDVTKPRGAKAGLVQLQGRVRTISVKMKEAESRLARLDQTVLIN